MKSLSSTVEFFPFIVNFAFFHNLKNKFKPTYEQRINLEDEKYICKLVYEIPLSQELIKLHNRNSVFVVNLEIKNFNCFAACDINSEDIIDYIKKIIL
jgi:hypothetical protein